jgi:hypothetical protein
MECGTTQRLLANGARSIRSPGDPLAPRNREAQGHRSRSRRGKDFRGLLGQIVRHQGDVGRTSTPTRSPNLRAQLEVRLPSESDRKSMGLMAPAGVATAGRALSQTRTSHDRETPPPTGGGSRRRGGAVLSETPDVADKGFALIFFGGAHGAGALESGDSGLHRAEYSSREYT